MVNARALVASIEAGIRGLMNARDEIYCELDERELMPVEPARKRPVPAPVVER